MLKFLLYFMLFFFKFLNATLNYILRSLIFKFNLLIFGFMLNLIIIKKALGGYNFYILILIFFSIIINPFMLNILSIF
jgi:hypothetical protein